MGSNVSQLDREIGTDQYHQNDHCFGLVNFGNTCYCNSVLQALYFCKPFRNKVLESKVNTKRNGNETLLTCLADLFYTIANQKKKSGSYAPKKFINKLRKENEVFGNYMQQDAHEFLNYLLNTIADLLREVANTAEDDEDQEEGNQGQVQKEEEEEVDDEEGVEKKIENEEDEEASINSNSVKQNSSNQDDQKSIISDTFEFKISSSVVCSNCNRISTTKETFKDLSIPIPSRDHPYYLSETNNQSPFDTRKKRDSSSSSDISSSNTSTSDGDQPKTDRPSTSRDNSDSDEADVCRELQTTSYLDTIPLARWIWDWLRGWGGWFWGPQVTLQDCLSIFFGTDPLEGDNEYSCDVCTKKNKGVKYLKILDLPEVLCIHFKRYESIGSAKITTHVSFPLTGLDLAPYMSEDSRPQCTTYNLIACICHHGSAILTGHYTTFALNCYNNQWYEFDDQYVTNVDSYQVENSEAYVLFYQKVE